MTSFPSDEGRQAGDCRRLITFNIFYHGGSNNLSLPEYAKYRLESPPMIPLSVSPFIDLKNELFTIIFHITLLLIKYLIFQEKNCGFGLMARQLTAPIICSTTEKAVGLIKC